MSDRLTDIFTLTIRDQHRDRNDVTVVMSSQHLQEFVRQAQVMLDGGGPSRVDVGCLEARVFALANGAVELRVRSFPDAMPL